jgi:hypothetical protein
LVLFTVTGLVIELKRFKSLGFETEAERFSSLEGGSLLFVAGFAGDVPLGALFG